MTKEIESLDKCPCCGREYTEQQRPESFYIKHLKHQLDGKRGIAKFRAFFKLIPVVFNHSRVKTRIKI